MYPISDLTAFCRKTTGDVPPKLVGASTTVVGSKMYLYGGRLVSERRMVSDIYMFDLETLRWDRLAQDPDDDIPQARYFHSADTWKTFLIIFGGMAIKPQSDNPEDLCVLNDVRLFDLSTNHWLPSSATSGESSSQTSFIPNPRYAHLSSVTSDRLFIIGGQDLNNIWLDEIYIYDLVTRAWVHRRDYARHCGTYRSVVVTAEQRIRLPQEELRKSDASTSKLGPPGTRFKLDKSAPPTPLTTQPDSFVHLPYSAPPTDEYPCDIYLFSNYNFTDVQREFDVFSPLSDGDFTITDRSRAMTGSSFPPGLRFPSGAILGTYFIVAGTYLSQTYQSFSIWALDLISMTWSRIDPGSALSAGSWFRACLWPEANKFMVFGNRNGNLVDDYNRRLLSWDHVTCIDLEAFGIYRPPPLVLDIPMQELGLAAFEEGVLADFEIVCDDGRKVKCSRKLLEDRWPWFKEQRRLFLEAATRAMETMPAIPQHVTLPTLTGNVDGQEPRPDPRLTPRAFHLSEPYPITLALVQYFYSMALITPLQHAPAVLSQLLLLSSTYDLMHLQSLVKHAMHRALSYATSVGIYGVSTLCSCRSLQIRALRVVMAYSQRRPGGRSRPGTDREAPGGGRQPDVNGGGGNNGSGSSANGPTAARPRGMSDASYLRGPSETSGGNYGRGFAQVAPPPKIQEVENRVATVGRPRGMSEGSSSLPRPDTQKPVALIAPQNRVGTLSSHSSLPVLPRRSGTAPMPMSRRSSSSPLAMSHTPPARAMLPPQTAEPDPDHLSAVQDILAPILEIDPPPTDAMPPPSQASHHISAGVGDLLSMGNVLDRQLNQWGTGDLRNVPSLQSLTSDDDPELFCDSALLSPHRNSFTAFHLPRASSQPSTSDSDALSMSSATSYSSLSTPSLSRASSYQHLYTSPPISPASSMAAHEDNTPTSLDVIQEAQHAEDHEVRDATFFDDGNSDASSMTSSHTQRVDAMTAKAKKRMGVHDLDRLHIEEVVPVLPGSSSEDIISGARAENMQGAPAPAWTRSPAKSQTALARLFSKTDKTAKKTKAASDPPKKPMPPVPKRPQRDLRMAETAAIWSGIR